MHPPPRRHRGYTPVRRWQPLTDAEWGALLPFVLVQNRPGRPLKDARRRMDAVFWIAAAGSPWRELPPRFGKPDTASRHFRRLSDAGLWERLLRALARPDAPAALRAVEHWVCCACRRVGCRRDLPIITTAWRLGFLSALRAPPHMLPDVDLSERVHRWMLPVLRDVRERGARALPPGFLCECRRWLTLCGGRQRIPRFLQPA